jgi:hypothetical protein
MPKFKDSKGRDWDVDITVAVVRRVRNEVKGTDGKGFELLELADVGSETFRRVLADPVQLGQVLFVVCLPQAREAGIDRDQFEDALAGDSLADGTRALLESIAAFSPSPAIRAALGKEMRALTEATERVHRRLADSIDEASMTSSLETLYAAQLAAAASGSSASAAPPSSA